MYYENRFSTLFNTVKGIYRKRSIKKRFGLSSTSCYYQLHFGLRSLYIEKPHAKRKTSNSWGDTFAKRMKKEFSKLYALKR
jgi:hypothetical protein